MDRFADVDLQEMAVVRRCNSLDDVAELDALLADAPAAPLLLTGAMENRPTVIEHLAPRFPLITGPPDAIRAARRLDIFDQLVDLSDVRIPERRTADGATPPREGTWLRKPLHSCAGLGVRFAERHERLPDGHYLQSYIPGRAIGAAYFADDDRVSLLGATRQILGDARFGAHGFLHVGNVGPAQLPRRVWIALTRLGHAIVSATDLRGPFGVDAIVDDAGAVWPLEINPRFTAGFEVIERATGVTTLRPQPTPVPPVGPRTVGKAVLYARQTVRCPDLRAAIGHEHVADVPAVGTVVQQGHPVCTLLASGGGHDACMRSLVELAERFYTVLSHE